MKLKALIIDDEPLAHEIVREYAAGLPFLEIVGSCYTAMEALGQLNREQVDLIFLDIHLPQLKGLDLLRTLSHPPLTIVTTAYEEYALEGFELKVVDYLLKPFRLDRFVLAVNRALEQYRFRQQAQVNPPTDTRSTGQEHLLIRVDRKLVRVPVEEVSHLESYGNYVKVWTEEGYQLNPGALTQLLEELKGGAFIRVHKSFAVNRSWVQALDGNRILLTKGQEIPLSKSRKQAFKEAMGW